MKYTRGWLLLGFLAAGSVAAFGQTLRFLDAPVVSEKISLRWGGTKLQIKTDNGQYMNVPTDATYAAKNGVKVTVDKLNPLEIRAAGTVKLVDDPTFLVLAEFLTAVKTMTANPPFPTMVLMNANPPATCSNPAQDLLDLQALIYHTGGTERLPKFLDDATKDWVKAINDSFQNSSPGWTAVGEGVASISKTSKDMKDNLDNARKKWAYLVDCIKTAAAGDQLAYVQATLSGGDTRIAQIAEIQRWIDRLAESLRTGYVENKENWAGTNNAEYVVADAQPTREKMNEVTVKLSRVSFEIASVTSVLSVKTEDLGSATITVQRWSPWVIEKSVGAVFGVMKQPTYGTSTNAAGQTVVARVADKAMSVNPAIMMNLVCRCAGGLPMVQFGVATSKDLPAFLAGAGLRLFGLGKGDFSISYGGMVGWYRDLNKLQVGSVITGTKDIDADLAFIKKPHIKAYFGLQYKF